MKKLLMYFIQGLLVTVPVAITLFVVYKIIDLVSSAFSIFGTIVSPAVDPFIYLLISVGIIFLMGLLGSSIILQPLFNLFDSALERTPFIKTIYSSVKDLMEAFVGGKKRFDKPVLVVVNKENNIRRLGFVTQQSLSDLKIQEGFVAVYLPMSYSFSGNLIIVPAENISPVDASSTDVMKFIISGGVTEID
jgi:uncharacterized membrane protein